ncbi:MAG: hypothetical protein WB510_06445 [Candidatus Sulfotelmatobacter sp.]
MASPTKLELQALPIWRRALSHVCPGRSPSGLPTILLALLCGLIVLSPGSLSAQSSSGQNPPPEPDGVNSGGYLVHSSVELGYRSNDLTGSGDMYDTLVNLQTGPRILDQTLSMQSLDHQGLLFDDLYLNSFGWGGEPNNALRLRADKSKWYNLQGSFRRDQYFSDYDLLANPLNPPISTPSIPVLNSPSRFATTRRMSDFDLTLLPQSRVSVRLGYSHNNMTGPSYSAVHEGTDGLLLLPWNTTMNSYRMGVDWRVLPRTVVSYDQFLNYYRGDTDAQLAPFAPALLPGGTSVELGLPIDTVNKTPCAVKAPATSLINSSGTLTNTTCSAYFSYTRNQRVRTSSPMERLGLRSNYFQRVDVVASFSYSSADMTTPLDESFNGLLTRTNTRAVLGTGTADASQISNVLDLEATVHLTKHLRVLEKFYSWAFRIPENGNFSEVDSVCTGTCNLLTPLSATAPATTDTLTQSSFNQTWKRNQIELAWDVSKKVGARIGYRYGDQIFDHFNTFQAGGEDSLTVHEQTALLGFWTRPTRTLRLNFDLEHTNYDNVIVRMAPRKESRYRFQTGYTPRPWAVLGGSINILEDANDNALTNYVGHNRNYGLTASLSPQAHFAVDVAYNYNDAIQNALICFADTPPTGATLPFVAGATLCPGPIVAPATVPVNPLLANSFYTNNTHFGMTTVRFKFDKRTTINAGGSVTNVDGSIPQFNVLQPLGSSQYRYYQPVANLSVDLGHKLAWNTGWNYYQYNEGSFVGPTAPRYFHANSLTESVRYAF